MRGFGSWDPFLGLQGFCSPHHNPLAEVRTRPTLLTRRRAGGGGGKNGYKIDSKAGNFQLSVSGAGFIFNKQTILSKT